MCRPAKWTGLELVSNVETKPSVAQKTLGSSVRIPQRDLQSWLRTASVSFSCSQTFQSWASATDTILYLASCDSSSWDWHWHSWACPPLPEAVLVHLSLCWLVLCWVTIPQRGHPTGDTLCCFQHLTAMNGVPRNSLTCSCLLVCFFSISFFCGGRWGLLGQVVW